MCLLLPPSTLPTPPIRLSAAPSPLSSPLHRHPCHNPQSITLDGRRMGSPRGSHDERRKPRGPTQQRRGDCAWVGRVRV